MKPADPRAHLMEFLGSLPSLRGRAGEELAVLSSLELLQVVSYLEKTYGVNLAKMRIEPDDLRSVEGLLAIVARCTPS